MEHIAAAERLTYKVMDALNISHEQFDEELRFRYRIGAEVFVPAYISAGIVHSCCTTAEDTTNESTRDRSCSWPETVLCAELENPTEACAQHDVDEDELSAMYKSFEADKDTLNPHDGDLFTIDEESGGSFMGSSAGIAIPSSSGGIPIGASGSIPISIASSGSIPIPGRCQYAPDNQSSSNMSAGFSLGSWEEMKCSWDGRASFSYSQS